MKKSLVVFCLSLIFLLAWPLEVTATYGHSQSYTYDRNKNEQPSPDYYVPDFAKNFGCSEQKSDLTDIFFYEEQLYGLDAAKSRVIILDQALNMKGQINFYDASGKRMSFASAGGFFLCPAGIYIADRQERCVYRFTWTGKLIKRYERPNSPAYDAAVPFAVNKVIVDKARNVYALVDGLYSGAVMLSETGDFLGFFGPNEVEMTLDMLIDQNWKKLLTDEQKKAMNRFVPIAYTNFDIDTENFVYTCSANCIREARRVRKLNPSGKGLWDGRDLLFGDFIPEEQQIDGLANLSRIVDVDISDTGVLSILDAARGRIFQYDRNGQLLGIFGGSGKQLGCFTKAAAIESIREYVYVLDGKNGMITRFSVTEYGRLLKQADRLYNDGEYAVAQPIWKEIIARNCCCPLAYIGLGKAAAQQKNYAEALKYFRLGDSREDYSAAFSELRFSFMRTNFPWLILIILIVMMLIKLYRLKFKKHGKFMRNLKKHLVVALSPSDGVDELIYTKSLSYKFSTAVVVFCFLLEVVKYFAAGFPFNPNNPAEFNIFLPLMTTIIIYLIFVSVNWSVASLSYGRGTAGQIYCVSAYALLPYLATQVLILLLSNVLSLEGRPFLLMLSVVGYIWSLGVLIAVIGRLHDFTLKATIANLFLTLAGIVIVYFLLFLCEILFEQVSKLVLIVYNELTLRS